MRKNSCLCDATHEGECQGRASSVAPAGSRQRAPHAPPKLTPAPAGGAQSSLSWGLPLPPLSSSRAGRKRFWVGRDTLRVCAGAQREFSRSTGSSAIFHSRPGQVMDGVWGDQYFHGGLSSHLAHSPSFSPLQPHRPVDPLCICFVPPSHPPQWGLRVPPRWGEHRGRKLTYAFVLSKCQPRSSQVL